jgi:transposase-like protein
MEKKVHYSEEVKWEGVRMRQEGMSYSHINKELGIKNKAQIQTWMR